MHDVNPEALRRVVQQRWPDLPAARHIHVHPEGLWPGATIYGDGEWYYATRHGTVVPMPMESGRQVGWAILDSPPPQCLAALVECADDEIHIWCADDDLLAQARAWAAGEIARAEALILRKEKPS